MAAQAAYGGGCSPVNGELTCRSQVVPWVLVPMAGQGYRGGQGMMQLSMLWWVSEPWKFLGEQRGRAGLVAQTGMRRYVEWRIRDCGGGKPESDVSCLHWALQVTSCSGPPLPENPTRGVFHLTVGELAFPRPGAASTPVLLLVLPLCCLPDYPQPAHSPSYLLWPA